jgi:hypothetical protein
VPPRPYYKGYNQKDDEELAKQFLYGRARPNKKGFAKIEYLKQGTSEERLAREALHRFLSYHTSLDAPPVIMAGLFVALRGESTRRLVFKFQKKGRRPDSTRDELMASFVDQLTVRGWKKEAAVHETMERYGLSRKAVFAALRRARLRRKAGT